MEVFRIGLLLLIVCSYAVCDNGSPKPLTVLLDSSWGYTPPLLEASEFFWEIEESLFWKFVNGTKNLYSSVNTDKEAYESAIDVAEGLLSPSVYNVLLFSLSLHTYSPAVQMFYQVSEDAYIRRRSSHQPDNCKERSVFMEVKDEIVCTIEELQDVLNNNNDAWMSHIDEFDHLFPSSSLEAPVVILYGELGTPEFAMLHSSLSDMATDGTLRYVFRHYVKAKSSKRLLLSGYGVQLTVKNTEYKAVDDTEVKDDGPHIAASKEQEAREVSGFVFSTLVSRHQEMKSDLKDFEGHLLHGAREMPELKLWQLQDLGFQAAQRIVSAGPELGLKIMKDISQNLPTQAKMLYKIQVDKALRKEIESNQKLLSSVGVLPGKSVLFLNGITIQDDTDIYQLLDMLLSESAMLDGLRDLRIDPSAYPQLLSMPVHGPESNKVVVDVRGKSVVFINDLEKERIYKGWSKYLKEFLRPTYPGMLRQIARNVFNIVFMFDPLSPSGLEMTEYITLFLDHMVPARLGLVLLAQPDDEIGVALCQGFAFLSTKASSREGLRWISKIQELSSTEANVTVDDVVNVFKKRFLKSVRGGGDDTPSISDVFSEEWNFYLKEASHFFSSKGFASLPQVLVNGVQLDIENDDIESAIVTQIQYQTYELQQAIFTSQLGEKDDVYNFFLDKPNVLTRINRHILAKPRVFDISRSGSGGSDEVDIYYFSQPEGEFTIKELSGWMIVDLSTVQGRDLAYAAINYSMSTKLVRVGLVHNGKGSTLSLVARAIQAAILCDSSASSLLAFVQALLHHDHLGDEAEVVAMATLHGVDTVEMTKLVYSAQVNSTITEHMFFVRTMLGLKEGQNAILSNGKLIGPFSEEERFNRDDWVMLDEMESAAYGAAMATAVESVSVKGVSPDEDTVSFRSDMAMKLASLLRSQPRVNRISQFPTLSSKNSGLHVIALEPDLSLTMLAVLDPLSPDTQRLAPILQNLQASLSIDITIYLNPVSKLSQIPITSFYRYVLQPELSFNEDGSMENDGGVAVFSSLPTSPLFTLSLDVPHSWLVEPVVSPYDLDNIHLAQVSDRSIHAEFTLEHILVEGQCFDASSDHPTPGLEFVLGTGTHEDLFDTIVMANLGYFQLKAGPGAWLLRLREGRSRDIYSIQSYSIGKESGKSEDDEEYIEVSINVRTFHGAGVVLKVIKRSGMEEVSLLTEEVPEKNGGDDGGSDGDGDGGDTLWGTLSNFLGAEEAKKEDKKKPVVSNETINIFSIASGHLYERFLRIMMLSVLKHTDNPVKFWFLKNYLSPTFKEFIPYMAEEYGFEFELVEYKWPRWLHPQTQKQRMIWGYKILFLDVLFPLSVKKIIFVDADQIVRADLKELLAIPLDGAPYAYTPFCDSRPDMQGFRFWDHGYWKNHLGNRRYHISALYYVDLVAFRRLAAGDRLRGQYQALSQDPNSLSNLDQDLPNNMIHSVAIKSLPQEWLWCETWCSQESKAQAKTIDLCNNPLTKEPKLQSAMRIVPEWIDYDNEIKELGKNFRSQNSHSKKIQAAHTEL